MSRPRSSRTTWPERVADAPHTGPTARSDYECGADGQVGQPSPSTRAEATGTRPLEADSAREGGWYGDLRRCRS